jgi:cell division protease FtsH
MAGGYTKQLPAEDRYLHSRSYMKDMLAYALGGRAAEEIKFNEITDGARSDIERATKLARAMVTDYGMSDKLGPRTFGHKEEMVFLGREISEQRDYSEEVARQIDEEVQSIINTAHNLAREILTKNKRKLDLLAKALITRETLEGKELEKVFEEIGLSKPRRKVKKTTIPAPVQPVGEGALIPQPKKVPSVPKLVPKQTPAPTD